MGNKETKLNTERTLGSMHLASLDEQKLENAQTRVWNHLSHSINASHPAIQVKTSKSVLPFWQRPAFRFSVATLVILSSVGSATYLYYKSKNDNTAPVVQNTPNQENDVKKLAAQRLQSLLGNVSYSEVESAVTTQNPTGIPGLGRDTSAPADLPTGSTSVKVYTEESKQLYEKTQSTELKVHYSEHEITLGETSQNSGPYNPYSYLVPTNNPKIDYSKPVNVKTWFSPSYSKTVVSQNDQVAVAHLYTPKYSVDYLGGKYAIKNNFDSEQYFGAYREGDTTNPELQFLKYILDPSSNVKEAGTQVIDGKTYTIFQSEISGNDLVKPMVVDDGDSRSDAPELASDGKTYKSKFYVDKEQFQLHMIESYVDNKLAQSTKIISSQDFSLKESFEGTFNTAELSGINTKEITIKVNPVSAEIKPSEFIKQYAVYYIGDAGNIEGLYKIDNSNYEAYKLYQSKDYDPNFVETNRSPDLEYLASYRQSGLNYYIYKSEPKDLFDPAYNAYSTVTVTDTKVTIDGVELPAKFIELKGKTNAGMEMDTKAVPEPMSLTSNYVIFKASNGLWYHISEYASVSSNPKLVKTGSTLKLLTQTDAATMDIYLEERKTAYPQSTTTTLDKVNKNIRLLPGDLSKDYSLKASHLLIPLKLVSTSDVVDSTCEKFTDTNGMPECLIEKFNGFRISFYKPSASSDPSTGVIEPLAPDEVRVVPPAESLNYMEYLVLDGTVTETQTLVNNLIKAVDNPKTKSLNISVSYKEVKGKTVVIVSNLDKSQITKIFAKVDFDNGYNALTEQLKAQGVRVDGGGSSGSSSGSSGSGSSPVMPEKNPAF